MSYVGKHRSGKGWCDSRGLVLSLTLQGFQSKKAEPNNDRAGSPVVAPPIVLLLLGTCVAGGGLLHRSSTNRAWF